MGGIRRLQAKHSDRKLFFSGIAGLLMGVSCGVLLMGDLSAGSIHLGGKSAPETILRATQPIRFLLWSILSGLMALLLIVGGFFSIVAAYLPRLPAGQKDRSSQVGS